MANEGRLIRLTSSDLAGTAALGVNLTNAEVTAKQEAGETTFASLNAVSPRGVCVDYSGNIYVSDITAHAIYKIDEGGEISLYAGLPGTSGNNGTLTNVAALSARFNAPRGLACDKSGNIYVADTGNHQIRVIRDGFVSHLAGDGTPASGFVDGVGGAARFSSPYDVAVAPNGDVYVADRGNNSIRRVIGGTVYTFAGDFEGNTSNVSVAAETAGSNALFKAPEALEVDANGNILVCDTGNYRIKKITPSGWVYWHSGSTQGKVLGTTNIDCKYNDLVRSAVDRDGSLYVVDVNTGSGSRLMKVNPDGVPSVVNDFNGTTINNSVVAVAFSPAGKLFVVSFN